MENSNIFLSEITEWLKRLGLPYITQSEAMLIVLVALLILLFLIWLIFRKARLWYWKRNEEINMLKSIDIHLKNVEEKLSSDTIRVTLKPEKDPQQEEESEQQAQTENQTVVQEPEGITAVGKSGRIYTEAELELLIRE